MLVAAMNPCPCGYYGDPKRECRCSPGQFDKYRQRISGPLLDRIDLHVEVPAVDFRELTAKKHAGESSVTIRARVTEARNTQRLRFATSKGVATNATNAAMRPKQVREHCALDSESQGYLEQAMDQMHLSARAHDRILKVARTLADLAGSPNIGGHNIGGHNILEAIQYRSLDRKLFH